MKDGRTHLAYRLKHTVGLDSDRVVSAAVYHTNERDAATRIPTVVDVQVSQSLSGSDAGIEDVVADRGYHKTEMLVDQESPGLRTCIPGKRKNTQAKIE